MTYFNDPNAPEYNPQGIVSADSSFAPDAKSLVAKIRISSKDPNEKEMIVLIEFNK